jgi:hypothetical protein
MFQPSTSSQQSGTLIELPKLDGYLEAGIAAGVDPTLPESDKLPVNGKSAREVYNSAVAWALTRNFKTYPSHERFKYLMIPFYDFFHYIYRGCQEVELSFI